MTVRGRIGVAVLVFACAGGPVRGETPWSDLIRGENLAQSARLTASASPYFPNTGHKSLDVLQDGIVAPVPAKMESSDFAAHWRGTRHVFLRLDLEQTAPIDRITLRVLGGRAKHHLIFPRAVSAWLSVDGTRWGRVNDVYEEKDFPVESGEAEIANVALSAGGALARYVVVHFHLRAEFLYVDEVAVIRGEAAASPDGNSIEAIPLHAGRVAFPDKGEIVVSRPPLPTFLTLLENGGSRRPGSFTAWLDLPSGVSLRGSLAAGVAEGSPRRRRFVAELAHQTTGRLHASRALFFEAAGPIPPGASIRITPVGSPGRSLEVPVRMVEIPRVPAPRALHVSLSWLPRETAAGFPDLIGELAGLGFSGLGFFPQYWKSGLPTPQEAEWIAAARAAGMDVIHVDSPFHVMEERWAHAPEIRTQRPGGRAGPGVSPCYRGRYYVEEIARIEAAARRLQPRWVFFDSELWTLGAREVGEDAWCDRLRSDGEDRTSLLARVSTEIALDLSKALSRAAPSKEILSGFYAVDPTHEYQGLFDFAAMVRGGVDLAMPSLYTGGDPLAVRDRIRAVLLARPGTRVIPWLTAGTLGEFAPSLLRASVLEAFFSGASGITYYKIDDFDSPLDFLAHAQAIAIVSRYERFFSQGVLDASVSAVSGGISAAARRIDGQILVLLGSYRSRVSEEISLPVRCAVPWRDVESKAELDARALRVSLAPGESRVFECPRGANASESGATPQARAAASSASRSRSARVG